MLFYIRYLPFTGRCPSEEEGLWVNACNPSWIERGLRSFCDECRPFFSDRLYEGAEVVGHLGGGTVEDASRWYEENKALYRG